MLQEQLKSELERQNLLMARLRGEGNVAFGAHEAAAKDLARCVKSYQTSMPMPVSVAEDHHTSVWVSKYE